MVRSYLEKNMQERIMVIDGAMGTTIQQYKFSEEDFRGERWKDIDQARRRCHPSDPCRRRPSRRWPL